jgi:hypothetical protein
VGITSGSQVIVELICRARIPIRGVCTLSLVGYFEKFAGSIGDENHLGLGRVKRIIRIAIVGVILYLVVSPLRCLLFSRAFLRHTLFGKLALIFGGKVDSGAVFLLVEKCTPLVRLID